MDNNKIKLLPTENIEDKKVGLKIIKEVAEMLKNGSGEYPVHYAVSDTSEETEAEKQ